MLRAVCLTGYRYSVYTWVVAMALRAKGVVHDREEIDPFDTLPPGYLHRHPFGRVPVLSVDGVDIFETAAITRFVDRNFDGPALTPQEPWAAARMDQVIGIVDQYAYWPMVRQVFAHGVFRPLMGLDGDAAEISAGLRASEPVLAALEEIATEGRILRPGRMTLAECHLAPMLDYFLRAEEGRTALRAFPRLGDWWDRVQDTPALAQTRPDLSSGS